MDMVSESGIRRVTSSDLKWNLVWGLMGGMTG